MSHLDISLNYTRLEERSLIPHRTPHRPKSKVPVKSACSRRGVGPRLNFLKLRSKLSLSNLYFIGCLGP